MTSIIQVSDSNAIVYISSSTFFGELQTIRDIGGTRNSSNTITISTVGGLFFPDRTYTRTIDTPYASLTLNPSTGTIVHAFPLSYNGTFDVQSLNVETHLDAKTTDSINIYDSLYVESTISINEVLDSTVNIIIGSNSAVIVPNIISTINNLGQIYISTLFYIPVENIQSNGYIYNTDFNSTITTLPYISSASLQSTIDGLGTYGFVSTASIDNSSNAYITYSNLQSTIEGLGTSMYISTSYLISTTIGLSNSIYSPSITSIYTSTVAGLGPLSYISSGNLISTVQGLGTKYISTAGLTSTVDGILYSDLFPSTIGGLGQIYISTGQLTSTVEGIFSNESVALMSTVNNLGITYIYIDNIISTIQGLGQIYISSANLVSAVSSLGDAGNLNNDNLISTVNGLGTAGYVSSSGLISTVSNVSASNMGYYTNVINMLGTVGFVSTASLVSTVNGIGMTYISTQTLTAYIAMAYINNDTQTQLTSSIQNLGTKGYISTSALVSTTTHYINLITNPLDYDYFLTNSIINLFSDITWPLSPEPQQITQLYVPNSNTIYYQIGFTSFSNSTPISFPTIANSNYYSSTNATGTLNIYTISGTDIIQSNISSHLVTTFINGASVGLSSITNICINSSNTFIFITATATSNLNGVQNPIYNNGFRQLIAINVANSRITMISDALYTGYYQYKLGSLMGHSYYGESLYNGIMAIDPNDTLYLGIYPWYLSGTWQQDSITGPIQKISLSNIIIGKSGYIVTTLAGSNAGFADGQGNAASFSNPYGVALDSASNIYVADANNHRIRKITPGGLVTTLAGSNAGFADGQGNAASFSNPSGVALDSASNIYVADNGNNRIRKITPGGLVTTLAGSSQGFADGQGNAASFSNPSGVAVDSAGYVYVADPVNNRIRKITNVSLVTTLAGSNIGSADGQGNAASFYGPSGVAVDSAGYVYVTDVENHKIRKITPGGLVTTLAGSNLNGNFNGGFADGQGTAAAFNRPSGVAVDSSGNVYVADLYNNRIRKITPGGLVTTLAGSNAGGSADGQGTAAAFNYPVGVAVDSAGYVYVADYANCRIRKITPGGLVTTLAGSTQGFAEGQGNAASFNTPQGVAVDSAGYVYVADRGNNRIRKITPGGLVSSFAGSGSATWADGQGNAASFNAPSGVAVDSASNIYVADTINNRIRKITPGGLVTTLAGSSQGFADDQGTAAAFYYPNGVAVDSAGYVYVADNVNNRIRKITNVSLVTTLAGSNAGFADGQGNAASFSNPSGVALDSASNIYVADNGNNRIRKITPGGLVTTVAGSNAGFKDGQGNAASFSNPNGVALDSASNIYVADNGNNRIRKITPGGLVTTLAGSGSATWADGQGTEASFNRPVGVAVDYVGTVYVGDSRNNRIRILGSNSNNKTLNILDIMSRVGLSNTFMNTATMVSTIQGLGSTYVSSITSNFTSALAGSGLNYGYISTTALVSTFTDINNINFIPLTSAQLVSTSSGVQTNLTGSNNSTASIAFPAPSLSPSTPGVYTVSSLAGSNQAFADGQGNAASFYGPNGVALDSAGYVYVADLYNHRIRKITPGGLVTTLAGSSEGFKEGQGYAALFSYPYGVAVDSAGYVYVLDNGNYRIRKITPGGLVTTLAGTNGGFADGQGTAAAFFYPNGVALDSAGYVYVADSGNNRIRKITPGGLVTTLAGSNSGFADGQGNAASFSNPSGVALDSASNIYVADANNHRIRKITPGGLVTTLAGSNAGFADGQGNAASFNAPSGVAVDSAGYVYVADPVNNRIRLITNVSLVTTLAGSNAGFADGQGNAARFSYPTGVALDSAGYVYVADLGNNRIRKIVYTAGLNQVQYENVYNYSSSIQPVNSIHLSNADIITSDIYSYCNITAGNFYAQTPAGTNGSFYADGTLLNSSSDRRLKQDIVPLSNAIEKVLQLSGVYYTLKDDTESKRHIGFIAQDVEPVFPELIFTDESVDTNKSMKYESMNVVLLEAIKELDIQCDELLNTLSSNI